MKVCLEKDPNVVQNLIGAGRELKSLDAQSWNCGTITRFIVSQEKIFDTGISPILTYGSEVWGVDHDGKLENDPIEFVQTKFIRCRGGSRIFVREGVHH